MGFAWLFYQAKTLDNQEITQDNLTMVRATALPRRPGNSALARFTGGIRWQRKKLIYSIKNGWKTRKQASLAGSPQAMKTPLGGVTIAGLAMPIRGNTAVNNAGRKRTLTKLEGAERDFRLTLLVSR